MRFRKQMMQVYFKFYGTTILFILLRWWEENSSVRMALIVLLTIRSKWRGETGAAAEVVRLLATTVHVSALVERFFNLLCVAIKYLCHLKI